MRRAGRPLAVWLALTALALVLPAPGNAATTIGDTFDPTECQNADTQLQGKSPGNQYAAPSAGVITSWSFQADNLPPQLKFKVARLVASDQSMGSYQYEILGESGLKTPIPNQLNTYTDIRVPVQPGDVIGFHVVGGPANHCSTSPAPQYFLHLLTTGDPAAGTMATFGELSDHRLDLSASLEPDCDSDGLGDETQDPSIASCHPRTVTLDASKNKVKKGRNVRLSGQIAETRQSGACAASQPVTLQRKKPAQADFTTVGQLQTDAAGAFSAREKVKKTYEYRAEAAETVTCAAGVSNTEKVKVKKK